ncbi:MAG: serine/threonine protein kinase [Cytophagia bacterium]|nr:MAG: serine/threonine protein kinase [Cytophagia bacterium]
MIGEQIANYKLIAKLGEGGMGTVYVGSHIQLGRKAAIKALHPNLVNNPQIRERFKNEAATLANIKHHNIVGLYDYLETTKGLFLIMEYVQGKPLDEFIQQVSGPISEDVAIHLMSQILDGFDYAHKQGIVHRDIKPSNLLITPEGEAKILDFGIAKILDSSKKSLTQDGSRMGTVLYMSPEQVRGVAVDTRSDIYSLGVTLFQMLTGKCPYDENNVTEYAVYQEIVNVPLPRANTFYPNISDKMQQIIDIATAKNPDERFQTCAAFKAALTNQNLSNTSTNPQFIQANIGGRPVPKPEILVTTLSKTPAMGNATRYENNYQNENRTITHTNYKLLWGRVNYWFSVILLLSLVGATAYVILFNPFQIEILEKVAVFAPKKPESREAAVKEKLKSFFNAIESHNFDNVKDFYADNIEEYFDFKNTNLKPVPDIKASAEAYWKTYAIAEKHEIDWKSFKYEIDENNNHIATITFNYRFENKAKKWNSINKVSNKIKFNKDLLIFSIAKI